MDFIVIYFQYHTQTTNVLKQYHDMLLEIIVTIQNGAHMCFSIYVVIMLFLKPKVIIIPILYKAGGSWVFV